jgi:ankyrin repeat protein
MTPLMWAAWKGKAGVVEWLVASSAKLDRQEKWGRTALVLAADEGHVDVVSVEDLGSCLFCYERVRSLFCTRRFGCSFKPEPDLTFLPC